MECIRLGGKYGDTNSVGHWNTVDALLEKKGIRWVEQGLPPAALLVTRDLQDVVFDDVWQEARSKP